MTRPTGDKLDRLFDEWVRRVAQEAAGAAILSLSADLKERVQMLESKVLDAMVGVETDDERFAKIEAEVSRLREMIRRLEGETRESPGPSLRIRQEVGDIVRRHGITNVGLFLMEVIEKQRDAYPDGSPHYDAYDNCARRIESAVTDMSQECAELNQIAAQANP